jgi:uncharacterized protein YjdB
VQLTATGHLADGTTRDVTASSTWESSNTQLALVSQSGLVTALGKGDVDVRATYQGITGSMHLSVALPAVTTVSVTGADPEGPFQLKATARRADGSTQDATLTATWRSSNSLIAAVSSTGYVTVLGDGDVDLSATVEGVAGTLHATVSVPKTFTISGTVFDSAKPGTMIADARVQVVGGPGHAFTDANGKFAIPGVPSGRTFLEITATGYDVKESDVTIAGSDVILSIGLDASQP